MDAGSLLTSRVISSLYTPIAAQNAVSSLRTMASNADKITANDKHIANGREVHIDKLMDALTRSTDLPSTFHLAAAALDRATGDYASIWTLLNPYKLLQYIWHLFYIAIQVAIIALFKPRRPRSKESPKQPFGRIAVIGAGLTGVSSAA